MNDRSDYLTIPEVIAVLRVPRSTFYRWRQLGRGARSIKLPNGDVRIRQSDLESGFVTWKSKPREQLSGQILGNPQTPWPPSALPVAVGGFRPGAL